MESKDIILSDFPIRDGNYRSMLMKHFQVILSDFPIRDGNHDNSTGFQEENITFRLSYKGWKHALPAKTRKEFDNFQTFL